MLCAGYVIFSISNLSTLFKKTYYNCWSTFTDCNETWTQVGLLPCLAAVVLNRQVVC